MKKIKIIDTSIKDIFKSSKAEGINIKNLEEVFKTIDEVGFESLEVWGGSCFEKMLSNNFNKSPWEILSFIKNLVLKTPLQTLIGAKNLVSFDYYPDDIIKRFIKLSSQHGISIFRVYDALNDIENLKPTIETILNNSSVCQGTIIYDSKKNEDYYFEFISNLKKLGCQSVCIKDVESMLIPPKANELFKAMMKINGIDIYLSTQNLKGLQVLNYFEAISNNCSGIDLSFIPASYYDNYVPSVFPIILSLKDSEIGHDLNKEKIDMLYDLIKKNVYPDLEKNTRFSSIIFNHANKNLLPEWLILMLENQLGELGETEKFDIVFEEILRIKKEVGNPSLSTPIGQIIGGQAILNTLISNNRWEIISDEMALLLNGSFGDLPEKIDDKILNINSGIKKFDQEIKKTNENLFESCKNGIKKLSQSEEDILSYCFFPDRTIKFLNKKKNIRSNPISSIKSDLAMELSASDALKVTEKAITNEGLNGKKEKLAFEEDDMNNFKDLDTKKIKEVMELLENSNLEEIKIESGDMRITLNKKSASRGSQSLENIDLNRLKDVFIESEKYSKDKENSSQKEQKDSSGSVPAENRTETAVPGIVEIKSPIVGTFYASPSPGEPPFTTEGTSVKKGDPLCIIEAMKLMNKINSDYDGRIIKIMVANEEPVEFGQTIMTIKIN
ncbi:MAG: acetyl-CoA carboxylase biotin carboxyl carrier protein [Candidatus Humimicrobiaceae bacterium]